MSARSDEVLRGGSLREGFRLEGSLLRSSPLLAGRSLLESIIDALRYDSLKWVVNRCCRRSDVLEIFPRKTPCDNDS